MMKLLAYKNDLEVVIEEQTKMIESKNQRMYRGEEETRGKDATIANLEGALHRLQLMNEDSRKKMLTAEIKIKNLTHATIKDFKTQLKERTAEVEVLKEMVKSSNNHAKAKDIDIIRLSKKLERLTSKRADSAMREDRASRLSGRYSPKQQSLSHNGPIESIPEINEAFEQTGGDPYDNRYGFGAAAKMTKTRQQEWEEAIELDKILEAERRQTSLKKIKESQENNYKSYMDRVSQPGMRNYSSGMSGVLGNGGTGSQYYQSSSMPDLLSNSNNLKGLKRL